MKGERTSEEVGFEPTVPAGLLFSRQTQSATLPLFHDPHDIHERQTLYLILLNLVNSYYATF